MTLTDFYKTYSSDTLAACSNQRLAFLDKPTKITGRVAYKLRNGGEYYALLFINETDSTVSNGTYDANTPGEEYVIHTMRVGLSPSHESVPETWQTVTVDGKGEKTVAPGEKYFTDPIPLTAKAGDYFWYEITCTAKTYPFHAELLLDSKTLNAEGHWISDHAFPTPVMIGSDRKVKKKVAFLGDSITQGIGTEWESYAHWAAKIAEGMPSSYSFWDLGIGCARAYDAASDGVWLDRVKKCDVATVCLGVNDLLNGRTADELINDISTVLDLLREAGVKTILFTVPPFDMSGTPCEYWYKTNNAIREELSKKSDCIFDFAAVLGRPEPNQHLSVYGGHPNAEGCAVLAKAFLEAGIL